MRPSTLLSAAAHALLIGVALGLPWLRVRPEPPAPVVRVRLVTPGDLAALTPPPAPQPVPAPVPPPPAPVQPAPLPEQTVPHEELPPDSLAPVFDPESPLGIATGDDDAAPDEAETATLSGPTVPSVLAPLQPAAPPVEEIVQPDPAAPVAAPPATQLLRSTRPMPRPGDAAAAAPETPATTAERPSAPTDVGRMVFQASVQAAIAEAQVYPPAAEAAGVTGTTRIEVSVARDGRLLQARVAATSGSEALDRATLAAARRARLPAAPASLPGESFRFEVGLAYGPAAP